MSVCKCGCGNETNYGDFIPGHDQKLRTSLENEVGGIFALQELILAAKKYSYGETTSDVFLALVRRVFAPK